MLDYDENQTESSEVTTVSNEDEIIETTAAIENDNIEIEDLEIEELEVDEGLETMTESNEIEIETTTVETLEEDIEVITETGAVETVESITTIPMLDEDEIAYDDTDDDDTNEEEFEEDFGTPIKDKPDQIVDPLHDIADVNEEDTTDLPADVEFIETSDAPNIENFTENEILDDDVEDSEIQETTTVGAEDIERLFDHTTIAYPIGEDISKPIFEAVEAEVENDLKRPVTNDQGLLIDTTTASPIEIAKPIFEAVEAELEDEDDREKPSATNNQGT